MRYRIGTSLLLVATAVSAVGCQSGRTAAGPKLGVATPAVQSHARAVAAQAQQFDAIDMAEEAVHAAPDDANARKALANAYFTAGRFRSAVQAYDDALALSPADDALRLRKALALLAQGQPQPAAAELDRMRDGGEAGLAYALAGRTERGVQLLSRAARDPNATARTRQNLALALALDGQWAQARTVAAQDLDPAAVERRVQQWAMFAASGNPAVQTSSLIGITSITSDEGRPIGLAYVPPSERVIPAAAAVASAPAVETIQVAAIPPASQPHRTPTVAAKPATNWAVQLGAYDRPELLEANWRRLSERNATLLANYDAVRTAVTIGERSFHRLAVTGFDSRAAAVSLCASLQAKGRDCFVRQVGPEAVQLARVDTGTGA